MDTDDHDDVWPWISAGAPGQVAITWLQSDFSTDSSRPGEAGGTEAKWDVMVAHSDHAFGCADGGAAPFTAVTASSEPVHTGTICQHGTVCQTDLTDRRLGDYHSVEVGADGRVHVAVSDTRRGGAVALPLHLRQVDGPTLGLPDGATAASADRPAPEGTLVTATVERLDEAPAGAVAIALVLVGLALLPALRRE